MAVCMAISQECLQLRKLKRSGRRAKSGKIRSKEADPLKKVYKNEPNKSDQCTSMV